MTKSSPIISGASNRLKRMKTESPIEQQKNEAEKMTIAEHHTILFLWGANKNTYGKLI